MFLGGKGGRIVKVACEVRHITRVLGMMTLKQ